MPDGVVVVITSCTSSKAALEENAVVQAESLYAGEQHRRLMRGVGAFRRACPALQLDLSIISAGHGLVDASALIGSYDATFSGVTSMKLTQEAERLRIPTDLASRLSRPYKLGLLLLGTDYLRAAAISPSWNFGGPTIAFCSRLSARHLDEIPDVTCVNAGKAEARRFSCGLVGLKGEMTGRLLEVLAHAPASVDAIARMSAQEILDLIASSTKTEVTAAA